MGVIRQKDKRQYKPKKKNEIRLSSYLKKNKRELGKYL